MDEINNRPGRRVFREDVKDFLLDAILNGRLQPGERIIETRVAQQIGVSQGPVREALRDLELFGFVESEPFRGTRVRQISASDLVEVYPIRAALEGVAAREAATKMDVSQLAHLDTYLETMRRAAASDDRKSHIEADIAFHHLIVGCAGNSMLRRMWQSTRLSSSTTVTVALANRSLLELADRHVPIIEALRDHNPAAAEAAMRAHIEELGRWIIEESGSATLSFSDFGSPATMGDA